MQNDDWDMFSTTACKGIRIKYNGNVLYCSAHRTTRENLEACYLAIGHLLGVSPDEFNRILPKLIDEGLTINAYKSS